MESRRKRSSRARSPESAGCGGGTEYDLGGIGQNNQLPTASSAGPAAITTAAGICAVLDLLAQGKLPQRGFVRQEDVMLKDFLANRFGKVYATRAPEKLEIHA